jgi:hypothetical protein
MRVPSRSCQATGARLHQGAARDLHEELAHAPDADRIRPGNVERDRCRIRSGRDDEVVLELALRSVQREVDLRIDVVQADLAEVRHVLVPVRTEVVMAARAEEVIPLGFGRGIGTRQLQAKRTGAWIARIGVESKAGARGEAKALRALR